MNPIDRPPAEAAPSIGKLNRATLIAAGAAAAILATLVLPAEYGTDPTGIGKLLGLTEMGKVKRAQAEGGTAGATLSDSITRTADGGTQVRLVIGPYGGREVKGVIKQGGEMRYEWASDGGEVEFDFHGETMPDAKTVQSYEKGKRANAQGVFKAPFEGLHGWFWHNLSAKPIVVTVTARGAVDRFAPLDKGKAQAAGTTTADAGAGRFDTGLPLDALMAEVVQPAIDRVYQHQGYVSDEKGTRSLFPSDDAGWKDARDAALLVAELANSLLLPGRRVAEPEWDKTAAAMRAASLQAAAAATKKNEEGYMEAGARINEACDACHERYQPAAAAPAIPAAQ